jgi:hypothetical protein
VTHPLSRVPFIGQFIDERFLEHRRRASNVAGIATAILALVLFEYRLLRYHVWSLDLALVAVVFVALKLSIFAWYRMND